MRAWLAWGRAAPGFAFAAARLAEPGFARAAHDPAHPLRLWTMVNLGESETAEISSVNFPTILSGICTAKICACCDYDFDSRSETNRKRDRLPPSITGDSQKYSFA